MPTFKQPWAKRESDGRPLWIVYARLATTTTGNLTTDLDAGSPLDGETVAAGDVILEKDNATGTLRGLYVAPTASGTATRHHLMRTGADVYGVCVRVLEGTANGGKTFWCMNAEGAGVVGTDALDFDTDAGGGSGDVVGPASATDNAVARFDTTTGKLIQNSAVTIDDSGNIATAGTVDGRDLSTDGAKLDKFDGAEATVASATTTDIGAAASEHVSITGTTTITGFGTVASGTRRHGRFTGALTLTHNATSLVLPGGANITTAAGDRFGAHSLGSGNWVVDWYTKADGTAVVGGGGSLASLSDVDLTGLATDDLLRWDGADWVPYTPTTVSLPGLQFLLYNTETASSEHNTSTAESSALGTYTLAANSYDQIKIEAVIRLRAEEDAASKSDFTIRFYEGATLRRTYTARVIENNTSGIDSGGRTTLTLSTMIAGGQGSSSALTVTVQPSRSNSAIGALCEAFRVYGYKDEALEAVQGPAGPAGADGSDVGLFRLDSIDLGDLAWTNQGGSTAVASEAGGVIVTGAHGATGSVWEARLLTMAAPATPYHVATCVLWKFASVTYHVFGPCFRASGSGKFNIWGPLRSAGGGWGAYYGFSDPDSLSSAIVNASITAGNYWGDYVPYLWMHITDDGTNRKVGWSIDGEPDHVVWEYSEGRTTDFTANEIGIGFADYTGATNGVAHFRCFNIYT